MNTSGADKDIERVRLELVTRKFMVVSVALIGVWVGIMIILTGAPGFIETFFSPWSRYVLGGSSLIVGGAVVAGGLFGDEHRWGWWAQVLGLIGLTLWYVFMGVAYSFFVVHQGLHIAGPGEPLAPAVTGRGYVPLIYLGLTMMSSTPLVTMIRLGRTQNDE